MTSKLTVDEIAVDTGGIDSQGIIVLDDGAGDSPELQLVGGSNDDTARIFLDDDTDAGESDLIARLPGTDLCKFVIQDSASSELAYVEALAGGAEIYLNGVVIASNYGSFTSGNQPALQAKLVTGLTNTVGQVLKLVHIGGAVAGGFGGRLIFELEDDGGTQEEAAAIDTIWKNAADGSELSYLLFSTCSGGSFPHQVVSMGGGYGLTVESGNQLLVEDGLSNLKREDTEPAVKAQYGDSNRDETREVLRLYRYTSPSGALDSMGGRLLFTLGNDILVEEDAATIDAVWDDSANGSEDSHLAFGIRAGGAALAEICRIDGDGLDLVSGADVYPESDGGGLFQRAPNHWRSPTDHFNAFSGWTWASYAPFDGAPSSVLTATFPSLLRLVNDDTTEDHYAYQSGHNAKIYARLTKGVDSYVGIRIQDSGNDNNDFVELRLIDGTTTGFFAIEIEYDVGGAGPTGPTTLVDDIPPQFYLLQLAKSGNTVYAYYTVDTPIPLFIGSAAGMTWTMDRAGIVFGQRGVANSGSRAGLIDFVEVD